MDYVLSIGTSAGIYLSHMPLSNPSVSGGVWSKIVQLDDSTNLYVALRAVDDVGQYSDYSNEIFVAEDPGFGVTSLEGIPAIPELASGELRVEALVDGDTESVQFSLDGVVVRVENIAPYALNGDNGPGDLIPWDPTRSRRPGTARPMLRVRQAAP
jgi:hypothetical protein